MLAKSKNLLCSRFFESVKRFQLSRRCRATLIDGKSIATEILNRLKIEASAFMSTYRRKPLLACILIGDNPASMIYVENKVLTAKKVGVETNVIILPSTTSECDLITQIHELNADTEVDGVLLQLPLPNHIRIGVCNEICPKKDVDGFTPTNLGKLFLNASSTFVPCTALAVHGILKEIDIETKGKNAVICGCSKHVGLPVALLLHSDIEHLGFNATTTICHRFTPFQELTKFCQEADIVISATGVPNLIRGEMIKKGAIVIDVGVTRIEGDRTGKSKIVGDVNFEEVVEVASYLTPVPGGVGPVTVAMLIQNTLKAAQQQRPS